MMIREKEIKMFGEILDTRSISVVNICGEAGIGKSVFVKQLMESSLYTDRMSGGYIDFGRIRSSSGSEMIDDIYDLCDQLKAVSSFKPMDFSIADSIDSKRSKRIPYSERSASHTGNDIVDAALDISDIAAQFIDLTYLGTGLKAWKVFMNIYQKYKPVSQNEKERYRYYDAMDDRTLRESLPDALAADITELHSSGCRRIVMFIDNFNNNASDFDSTHDSWLDKLMKKSDVSVLWVLVTRKPVDTGIKNIRRLELGGIDDEIICDYLKDKVKNNKDIERIVQLCSGSPFYIHRILELIDEKGTFTDEDWIRLESKERRYIAREYIDNLPTEKKDILFILAYAAAFDKRIFNILFPEKIFGLHKKWFEGPTFECINGRYCVQSSMADIIIDQLRELDPSIEKECFGRLFDAERMLIKQLAAGGSDIYDHLSCMCIYAKKEGNIRKYYNAIKELKNIILSSGNVRLYYDELKYLLDSCGENEGIKLGILSELSLLDYYRSDYIKALERCADGRAIAEKTNSGTSALQFIAIQMDIAHIAPSDVQNASDQVIELAEEYIELLENLRAEISYKTYITNRINAHIYIAREYTIKDNYTKALEYMQYIFEVLSDSKKVNALSLHDLYARSHEITGNIYGEMGDHESEEKMQHNAVEAYNIAEAVQKSWDPEFYLNFGLACKRYGESCLRQGRLEDGIRAIEAALSKYELVKSKNPEITDTYCKIGFACNDTAQYLLKHPNYSDKAEKYLRYAENTANEAIARIDDTEGGAAGGNRQLCNIRCTASRLSGKLLSSKSLNDSAESAFRKSINYGEESIKTAPSHPYGYFSRACAYCDYAEFLSALGRIKESQTAAACGTDDLITARKYTDDENSFSEVFGRLEKLQHS